MVKGEKVHSVAEIVLHNKDKVIEGALEQLLEEVSYKATPEHLVDKIDVDCATLHLGDTITVGDLDIAKNKDVEVMTHLDSVVVTVLAPNNADIPSDVRASYGLTDDLLRLSIGIEAAQDLIADLENALSL